MLRRRRAPIPGTLEETDAAWLTSALHDADALPADARVTAFTPEPLGGGVGFGGVTVRLRLSYEPADAGPATVVAKYASTDPINKGVFESQDIYGREIAFYRNLAHELPIRVPAHCGSAMDPPPPAPVVNTMNALIRNAPPIVHIKATENVVKLLRPSSRRYALLIEELDGDVYDMVHPAPRELLGPALDQLAALHAAFWGRTELVGTNHMRPLLGPMPRMYANVYEPVCRPLAIERWEWLDDDLLARLDDAAPRLEADWARMNEPTTFLHGDTRIDNLLFPADGAPIFIDWGATAMGHPGFDIGYMLSSTLDGDDAPAVLDALLDRYRTSLAEHGRQIDGSELRDMTQTAMRGIAIQLMAALPILKGGYGDASLTDCWMPRLVRLLDPVAAR